MSFIRVPWIILVLTICLLLSAAPAWAQPDATAGAAVLIDGANGQVLYEKNPHQRMYPASTTKIVTAIIALENGKLDDLVTVTAEAEMAEGSSIGLRAGEILSLEDLLYALMLSSGNDSAIAIANHVGGSVSNFADMMNKKAAELGAVNTHFNNPNGLPDPDHYTTAYDLSLMTSYAMQNPEFRRIVGAQTKNIHREDPKAQTFLLNHNKMLWRYEDATGVKTGYTNQARQCLVTAAKRRDRELIATVLGCEGNNVWNDAKVLLDYGFSEFTSQTLTDAGRYVTDTPVRYGMSNVSLQTAFSLTYNFPADKQAEVRREVILKENITAPVQAGEKMGEMLFFSGEKELGKVDLIARQSVERKLTSYTWPWLAGAVLLFLMILMIRTLVHYHYRARKKRWDRYYRRKSMWQ